MSNVRSIRCRVGGHRWSPDRYDVPGGYSYPDGTRMEGTLEVEFCRDCDLMRFRNVSMYRVGAAFGRKPIRNSSTDPETKG